MLIVSDFSQVEARANAWAAGDVDALEVFKRFDACDKINGDPYRVMATRIYGGSPADYSKSSPERKIGKICELAAGYGQGAGKACPRSAKYPHGFNGFKGFSMAAGADWGALAPLTPASVIAAWRTLHEPIVDFWRETQDAALEAAAGGSAWTGPFEWTNVNGIVICRLPSGRCMAYHGMVITESTGEDAWKGPSLSYLGRTARGPAISRVYGGLLVENMIQAMCRDLLARAWTTAEAEGLRPVLTVHDELVCDPPGCEKESDAKEALALLEHIMNDVPGWAAGMPIASEGFVSERYTK